MRSFLVRGLFLGERCLQEGHRLAAAQALGETGFEIVLTWNESSDPTIIGYHLTYLDPARDPNL